MRNSLFRSDADDWKRNTSGESGGQLLQRKTGGGRDSSDVTAGSAEKYEEESGG